MYQFSRWLKGNWPLIFIFLVIFVFFWRFFLKGLLPIPADIIPGAYFPWYDLHFTSSPFGIPVKNNVLSDVVSIVYPWRKLAIDQMKQGAAPLWNPYILSGNVLLANFQSAAFYPLNVIYWLIPDFAKAWSAQIILQPFLAWLFIYVFLRNNKFSKLASVFGSSVWAFSGFFAVWLEYNTIVQAALYFPLILYSIQKSTGNKKFYILLALAVSFSFYAGYPQITLYELVFAGLFVLVVLPKLKVRSYFALIFSVLLGIGLSLPFLLPGYEAAKLSIRGVDNVATESHIKFILPVQVITFIAPDYFGSPPTRNYWLAGGAYENSIIFAGVPALILFLASFLITKKKRSRLLYYSWLAFFIAAMLAFKNPLSVYLGNSNILLFSSSVMGRLAMVMMFGIAVSSAFVVELINQGRYQVNKLLIPVMIAAVLIIVFGFYGYYSHNYVALRNLIFPFSMFVAVLTLVTALIKLSKYKYFILMLVLIVELVDVYRFHDKYNTFSPSEFLYPKSPVTDFLISQAPARFESESGPIMPSNMWMPYGLYSASGQDAVGSLRYNKFLGFINTGEFLASDRYAGITNYNSQLFDFLGISDIAAIKWKNGSSDFEGTPSGKFSSSKLQNVFDYDRSIILKNTKAYPRIFSVGKYKLATTDADFVKLLSSEDLSKTVILEESPQKNFGDSVVDTKDSHFYPSSTSVQVNVSGDSMLVITQSDFPGWRAYIDGVETHLYRADYDFMAVIVPVGDHKVSVKYEPESFKLGLIGGAISAFCLLACSFYLRKINGRVL